MMKKFTLLASSVFFLLISVYSQSTYELKFTGEDNEGYVQLDSIKILNLTQECDTTLIWPDTVMVLTYLVGVEEITDTEETLKLFQNYPNPVTEMTKIKLYIPERVNLRIIVTDIVGRVVLAENFDFKKGNHFFNLSPGNSSLYFFTALMKDNSRSIKILNTNTNNRTTCLLEYIGNLDSTPQYKSTKETQDFSFTPGNQMLYISYANTQQSGKLHVPFGNSNIIMSYKIGSSCPGYETVLYDGQTYNTIQIHNQCWFKENLNVGSRIDGDVDMTNNSSIEKFCYDDDELNCITYGGLYEWDEMMQYVITEGAQGICPLGWHVPSDKDWKLLEGTVDSQYGIWDDEWHDGGTRGYDAGKNLKSSYGWFNAGNGIDFYGFTALPGGYLNQYNAYYYLESNGSWWTSSEHDNYPTMAWPRSMNYSGDKMFRNREGKVLGFSVRCIKD